MLPLRRSVPDWPLSAARPRSPDAARLVAPRRDAAGEDGAGWEGARPAKAQVRGRATLPGTGSGKVPGGQGSAQARFWVVRVQLKHSGFSSGLGSLEGWGAEMQKDVVPI